MGKLKNIGWTIGVVLAIASSIFIYTTIGGSSSWLGVLFLLVGFVIVGLSIALLYYRFVPQNKSQAVMNSTTVVESLKRVFKVVTAEGHFTEILDIKDTKTTLSFLPSTKKALIIVKAKVMMGYDFSEMEWEVDEANRKLNWKKKPTLKVISITPEITYYNIENGLLNKFNNEDFNKIQAQSIERITEVALTSELPKIAAQQAHTLITEMAQLHQWQLEGVHLLN
jgi:preprotein translocase subunit YajC